MKGLTLPPKLEELVSGLPFREENIGLSGSQVLIYDDFVLKTGPEAPDALSEARLLSWLEGKLPAPKCLWFSTENGRTYLLMTRVKGKMACSEEFMSNPQKLIYTLSQGLRLLWNTDVSNCPVKAGLDEKLASAAARVEAGLVSTLDAGEADQFTGIDEVAGDIAMKISDAIYGGFNDFPECDYEDFVGFCADCGCTIAEGDIFDYDGENFICEGCFHANDELDEDEDEDELDEDEDVADETPVDEPVVETTENPVEA